VGQVQPGGEIWLQIFRRSYDVTVSAGGRQLRAAVFALVALVVGLLGHATTSHAICATDLRACVLLSPLVAGVGWLLAGRERGCLPLLLGTYAVQALLHLVLHGGASPSVGLLSAHLIAGAAAALGLRHGERTVARFDALQAAGARVLSTLSSLRALVAAFPHVAAGLPAQMGALLVPGRPWRPRRRWLVAAPITRAPPLAAR
jgi:hypothetical protein